MQVFLSIHIASFVLFILALLVWPIVYYTSTLTKFICPIAELLVYFLSASKFGLADCLFQCITPVLSRRANPHNENIHSDIKLLRSVLRNNEEHTGTSLSSNDNPTVSQGVNSESSDISHTRYDKEVKDKLPDIEQTIPTLDNFLNSINLICYLPSITSKDILNVETLLHISENDYNLIGVSIGHRIKIKEALTRIFGSSSRISDEQERVMVNPIPNYSNSRKGVFGLRHSSSHSRSST
jgi:hypothetical protein